MKKIIIIMLIIILGTVTSGCVKGSRDKLVISLPDGAPMLVAYSFLERSNQIGGKEVEIKIFDGPSSVASSITSGEADVAVLPTNIAAKLYNTNVDVKLASVNLFGVLYLIGNEPVTSIDDLKGKVVCNIGRGGTPDLTLKLILDGNGIDYVDSDTKVNGSVGLTYVSASSEAVVKIETGKCDYAVIGEPFATWATEQINTSIVLDLQGEWNRLVGDGTYMQAGVVLTKKVYENLDLTTELMAAFENNSGYIEENYQYIKQTLATTRSSISINFTLESIKRLNIGHISAVNAKADLEKYFSTIVNYDSKFIGGKLPDSAFYYGYEEKLP